MNDRELLEYAAKAAGYKANLIKKYDCGLDDAYVVDLPEKMQYFILWNDEYGGYYPDHKWNPLTDDGDALRLAVKLGLFLVRDDRPIGETESDFSKDPYAATRRAIVRAAAEIGKTMP